MSFRNRVEAGRHLAASLENYKDRHPVILALPRGGVPVAAEIAASLEAPLDLVLVRKIGTPLQPELAMGAVVDANPPVIVRNEDVIRIDGVSEAEFDAVRDRELAEIARRRALYLGGRKRAGITGRTVIVVDDGVATGATTRAALRGVRAQGPGRLVLAVPVGPTEIIEDLRREADDVVCLEDHALFGAIGYFYEDFSQVSDEEVRALLARFPARDD